MNNQLFDDVEDLRDKIQIYYDIIRISAKPPKATKILRKANIQYNSFVNYMNKLCSAGLTEKVPVSNGDETIHDKRTNYVFKATQFGLEWSNMVNGIYRTLQDNCDILEARR